MPDLFSIPIFFIVFRETLEAAIIISVLLGLVEQIVNDGPSSSRSDTESADSSQDEGNNRQQNEISESETVTSKKRLIKKLRIQIFAGAGAGLLCAFAIGAAFIAVWFTKASDLYGKSEELWEGIFQLIASIMIFVMGVGMLKLDRSKTKWRLKLQKAYSGKRVDGETNSGKWILFILPFITVLREGLEAVVFVGGVSLGQAATAIPLAAIVGIIVGLIIGFVIYAFASRTTLTVFLITMTSLILLIGAGLFTRSVAAFQNNAFNNLLGAEVDDAGAAGNGPGSYDVRMNVWHLDCCNPNATSDQGWTIFGALFGWSNNASLGSVLAYCFYWLAVIVFLIYAKWKEGRSKLANYESAAGKRRREFRAQRANEVQKGEGSSSSAEKVGENEAGLVPQ